MAQALQVAVTEPADRPGTPAKVVPIPAPRKGEATTTEADTTTILSLFFM